MAAPCHPSGEIKLVRVRSDHRLDLPMEPLVEVVDLWQVEVRVEVVAVRVRTLRFLRATAARVVLVTFHFNNLSTQ